MGSTVLLSSFFGQRSQSCRGTSDKFQEAFVNPHFSLTQLMADMCQYKRQTPMVFHMLRIYGYDFVGPDDSFFKNQSVMTEPRDGNGPALIGKSVAGAWAKEVFQRWYDSHGGVPPMVGVTSTSSALLKSWVNDKAPTIDMHRSTKVPAAAFAEVPWGRLFKLDPFTRPTRHLPPNAREDEATPSQPSIAPFSPPPPR